MFDYYAKSNYLANGLTTSKVFDKYVDYYKSV